MYEMFTNKEKFQKVWKLYFVEKKTKTEINTEEGISRVTINKYIKYIETALSNNPNLIDSNMIELDEDHLRLLLPERYFIRKKRVLTAPEVEQIKKYIHESRKINKNQKLTEIHRRYSNKYYKNSVSYSSFYRVAKMMDIAQKEKD